MSKATLRIEQYETVRFDTNVNPLGIPDSVRRAISENISSIIKYPDVYYDNLKKSIAEYHSVSTDEVIIGNGSSDLIRLFTAIIAPKKSLLLCPTSSEYEHILRTYESEVVFYDLKEEDDFILDMKDLVTKLDSSIDMIIIGNPNNPTSKKIEKADIDLLAEVCKELNIFLLVDEMYIEFMDDEEKYTSIPLISEFTNMAVLRSVSKFFAVPGLRFGYALLNNPEYMNLVNITSMKNNVASLSAISGTVMFNDKEYIAESKSMIHTERSLVYLAMSTCKTIKLYKPDANYMLMRMLNEDVNCKIVAKHCAQKGIIIRQCDDIRGLNDKYIRFCFMKPKQNDLMVNTILEII